MWQLAGTATNPNRRIKRGCRKPPTVELGDYIGVGAGQLEDRVGGGPWRRRALLSDHGSTVGRQESPTGQKRSTKQASVPREKSRGATLLQ